MFISSMVGGSNMLDYYSQSYDEARSAFLYAAKNVGQTRVLSQELPGYQGATGEALTQDAVYIGDPDAKHVLVMLCGTHGLEGYASSALLTAFLDAVHQRTIVLPTDVAVLLVHAVNPYGFSYMLRTNERNVDLNRNFIDFSTATPANPLYAQIHQFLCGATSAQQQQDNAQALQQWIAEHGKNNFFRALFDGQYDIEEGLIYGGQARQWSNLALENVAHEFLQDKEKVVFIDWHTGLGEYGHAFYLCFNEPGSSEWQECCEMWGQDNIETKAGFDGSERPKYSGLVFNGVRSFVGKTRFVGAVIEFGTTPPEYTISGLQADNRLRFDSTLSDSEREQLKADAFDAFCPLAPEWRLDVLKEGLRISERALHSLNK